MCHPAQLRIAGNDETYNLPDEIQKVHSTQCEEGDECDPSHLCVETDVTTFTSKFHEENIEWVSFISKQSPSKEKDVLDRGQWDNRVVTQPFSVSSKEDRTPLETCGLMSIKPVRLRHVDHVGWHRVTRGYRLNSPLKEDLWPTGFLYTKLTALSRLFREIHLQIMSFTERNLADLTN